MRFLWFIETKKVKPGNNYDFQTSKKLEFDPLPHTKPRINTLTVKVHSSKKYKTQNVQRSSLKE